MINISSSRHSVPQNIYLTGNGNIWHNTSILLRRLSELLSRKEQKSVSQKRPTYWVRSKQINEIGGFGRRSVPAKFKTFEKAQQDSLQLNLQREAFHRGYFIEAGADR